MDGPEGAGALAARPRQRVDVEEAPVIDIAGGEPPVAELVVLAFEQMMQRQRWRGAIRSGAISLQTACDDLGRAGNGFKFGFEVRRFLAARTARPLVTRGQRQHVLAGRTLFR